MKKLTDFLSKLQEPRCCCGGACGCADESSQELKEDAHKDSLCSCGSHKNRDECCGKKQ